MQPGSHAMRCCQASAAVAFLQTAAKATAIRGGSACDPGHGVSIQTEDGGGLCRRQLPSKVSMMSMQGLDVTRNRCSEERFVAWSQSDTGWRNSLLGC
jgi:hypothetical protein